MKRTHKLPALLLAMLMLVSLTLTGCQKKEAPVPAEDVAVVLFDMMLKNDAASAMELFGYSSEEEAREDMGMDGDFYGELADEMVSQFEDMGATVSNEDVQACVDAFISMFEHVEFQAKLKEADEEAGTAVVTCTISTFDPEAINNAVNDVITELMSSPEIIEGEDVDALYSLILAKMAETYALSLIHISRANAAIIEASKAFSKELMKKYHIPTARYETFTDLNKALSYIEEQGAPIVVKADGLALGKGVVVAATVEEAKQAAREMMEDKKFGESGSTVVIEECMVGPEVTVLAFCDGEHLVPMLSSQDHKRAYDGNQGPNTGGMGAFCPSPKYTPELAQECMEKIFLPTVAALKAEGRPFKGVIYFGLMLTKDGPKVVEYNARFGDPETQPILSMLDSDLLDIFEACVDGTLDRCEVKWKDGAACCLVLASGGYPVKYQSGYPISGLEEAGRSAVVFHAGTKEQDGQILTAGGRVLGVTATGSSLEDAITQAYDAAKLISFQDMHFRTDIGKV